MAMRLTTGADMQGWLDKRAGGKKDSLSIGKLTHHWDKRYFLLRGPLLHDGSVSDLEALLDPARGAAAPHAFYVPQSDRDDLIEFLTRRP